MRYRVGGHWERTIIRVGEGTPDEQGRRPDDELIGVMDDPGMARLVVDLLNALPRVIE